MRVAKSSERHFEAWLANMDEALREFTDSFPVEIRDKLDYSIESIDVLEQWLMRRYNTNKEAIGDVDSTALDRVARYVGETIRRSTGSQWVIDLKDDSKVFFGVPFLTGGTVSGERICPLALTTASLDRRTGHFISTVVRNLPQRPLTSRS
jgi:hypothetical protein